MCGSSRVGESEREFAGIVYGHQLQLTIGQAVRDLKLAAEVLEPNDICNRVQYLPLQLCSPRPSTRTRAS